MGARKRRPRRQVWLAVFTPLSGLSGATFVFPTRRAATEFLNGPRQIPGEVVGPYVLAERVGRR